MVSNERGRRGVVDSRTTRHKQIEEVFGWNKTVGTSGKLRYLGRARNELWLELNAYVYNLARLANPEAAAA